MKANQIENLIEKLNDRADRQREEAERLYAKGNAKEARYFEGLAGSNETVIDELEKILEEL